jgi:hypothetical protein
LDQVAPGLDHLHHELDPERLRSVAGVDIGDVVQKETGFASAGVADDDNLDREIKATTSIITLARARTLPKMSANRNLEE